MRGFYCSCVHYKRNLSWSKCNETASVLDLIQLELRRWQSGKANNYIQIVGKHLCEGGLIKFKITAGYTSRCSSRWPSY
jgi:hypothetical protein